MANIPPDLQSKAKRDPHAQIDLIVRLKDDPSKHLSDLDSLGWKVQRTFSLTFSVAIKGAAANLPQLASQPWVLTIEEDKSVHTM